MKEPVFLDRDGVINENCPDYVRTPSDWVPLPGAFEAMARLYAAGHPLVVVTNQSGIARGYLTEDDLARIHELMTERFSRVGGRFAGIMYCPHAPWDNCGCRKPETGLVDSARRNLALPETGGWIVGDAQSDMELGRRTGLKTILVLTGRGRVQLGQIVESAGPQPDYVAPDLSAAVDIVLSHTVE